MTLVSETAQALASMRPDHADLVVSCRRIIERHAMVPPMWWLGARLLTAADPVGAAWDLVDELDADDTPSTIASLLPAGATVVTIGRPETGAAALLRRPDVRVLCADSRHEASSLLQKLERLDIECEPIPTESLAHVAAEADLVLIDAAAVCERRLLVPVGSHVVAATAASVGTPVWLAVGIGRRLPAAYVDRIAHLSGVGRQPWDIDLDDLPLGLVSRVVSAGGGDADVDRALRPDVACAPELLKIGT